MRAKHLSNLISFSIQLYLISRDERFRADVVKLIATLKQKARKVVENMEGDKQEMVYEIYHGIAKTTAELESRMKEAVGGLYDKLHIASTADTKRMSAEIEELTRNLSDLGERLAKLEQEKK